MKIKELMNRSPFTLDPEDNVGLAAETMRWASLRHLPVVREGDLIGMVSEHDVLGSFCTLGDLGGSRRPVREIMKSPVETIDQEADIAAAASRMAARKIGCLPVVDRGRLVGIVTVTDVLAHFPGDSSEVLREEIPRVAGLFAGDVMRKNPATARAEELVLDAAARMAESGIRHLVVVDEQGRAIGMLSDRDIRQAIGNPFRASMDEPSDTAITGLTVGDIMADFPVTVTADAELWQVARLLASQRFGALPVVDPGEQVMGIISYVDLLRVLSALTRV
jgi:CBS domain-containing protein